MTMARENTFDVSVIANGEPEQFRACRVEITAHGRTYVIEPSLWGGLWISTPDLDLPYHLGSVRMYRCTLKVNAYTTAADEALAREERTSD
jgi:hypothetical protein